MTPIPDKFIDLLTTKKSFAHVATVMTDGSPQVTPVWIDTVDGYVRVNSARGRVKDKNMVVGAKVAVSICDPDNAYRYVQIRGTVARVTEEGGDAHIDKMAKKYMGADSYPFRRPGEVRVIYDIAPDSVQGNG